MQENQDKDETPHSSIKRFPADSIEARIYKAMPFFLKAIEKNNGPTARYLKSIYDEAREDKELAVAETLIAWAKQRETKPGRLELSDWQEYGLEKHIIHRRSAMKLFGASALTGAYLSFPVRQILSAFAKTDELFAQKRKDFARNLQDINNHRPTDFRTLSPKARRLVDENALEAQKAAWAILGAMIPIANLIFAAQDTKNGTYGEHGEFDMEQEKSAEVNRCMDGMDRLVRSAGIKIKSKYR